MKTACAAVLVFAGVAFAQPMGKDRPQEGSLKAGDIAPDFELKSPDGKTVTKLSDARGKRPVVLVFGSYT